MSSISIKAVMALSPEICHANFMHFLIKIKNDKVNQINPKIAGYGLQILTGQNPAYFSK